MPRWAYRCIRAVLAEHLQAYARITINIFPSGSSVLEKKELDGSLKLATTLRPVKDEFNYILLCDGAMAALVASKPLKAQQERLPLSDLVNVPLITFDVTFVIACSVRASFRSAGIQLRETASIVHFNFALALVAARTGALVLQDFIAQQVEGKTMSFLEMPVFALEARNSKVPRNRFFWARSGIATES